MQIRNTTLITPNGFETEDVFIKDGIFSLSEETDDILDAEGMYLIPGFIDTHIHGIGGAGTEDADPEAILTMSETLASAGVTSFFPTIYTDTEERMLADIRAVVEAKGHEKGAEIAGIHAEGPFISPNRIGAQNPAGRKDPDPSFFRKMIDESKGLLKAMTCAPELPGIENITEIARKNDIVLLMGHTDATYEEAEHGFGLGIKHATHLFNAMSGFSHRKPGTAGFAMTNDSMSVEVIADGCHVHKDIARFIFRHKGPMNAIAITDSLRPTLQKEGPFTANGVPVEMGPGLWVTKGRPDLYQGSALTMHKAFSNLVSWGISLYGAVAATSIAPAMRYNLSDRVGIEIGKRADCILLDKDFSIRHVFIKGEEINVVQQS